MAAAEARELAVLDWRVTPFRAERFFGIWLPAAERAPAYGALAWSITRSVDDPLLFRQSILWRKRDDHELWWASDEVEAARREALNVYTKPILVQWHTLLAGESTLAGDSEIVAAGSSNGG